MRILLCAALLAAAQMTTTPERAIVAAVDAGNADALALLEQAVNINSGTHNVAGVRAVGDLFRNSTRLVSRPRGLTARASSAPGISLRTTRARGRASS